MKVVFQERTFTYGGGGLNPCRTGSETARRDLLWSDPRCIYCRFKLNRVSATLDHVKPVSRRGESSHENLVLACYQCNHGKGEMTPDEWRLQLLRQIKKLQRLADRIGNIVEADVPEGYQPDAH